LSPEKVPWIDDHDGTPLVGMPVPEGRNFNLHAPALTAIPINADIEPFCKKVQSLDFHGCRESEAGGHEILVNSLMLVARIDQETAHPGTQAVIKLMV
jgi:hypothetical protein